jgi:Fur family ferric uptake transcriptional regulator
VYHLDMTDPQVLVSALDDAGYRLTGPRRSVAAIVAGWAGHFTAADIAHEAAERGLHVGRATVFRTLDALEHASVVERIDLPSGEHAYVACDPEHHHHVVCSSCGRTDEVEDGRLAAVVQSIGRRTGYRIDEHRLELYGLCAACRSVG